MLLGASVLALPMEPFCSVGKKKDDQMSKMMPLCEHSHETGCTMYIKRKTVHYVASKSHKVMFYGPDSTIAGNGR